MNRDLIGQYQTGGERLSLAVRGLTPQDMCTLPNPADNVGRWTIQQLVAHIVDSDLVIADRMKRVIAEDGPTLLAFDENKWMSALHYELQPVEEAVAIVDLNRKRLGRVLEALPDAAWQRTGTHSERGVQTLEQLLAGAVGHLDHHLKFINGKREKLGKLMW